MDLAGIRRGLPSMTRAAFGDASTLYGMVEGKMGAALIDPARPAQERIFGRFDFAPALEQLGGGRERPELARLNSDHASVSYAKAVLTWMPVKGDLVGYTDPASGELRQYRVERVDHPLPLVVLLALSRIL